MDSTEDQLFVHTNIINNNNIISILSANIA